MADGQPTPSRGQAIRQFLLGGLLPVIAFTAVEAFYGTKAGLIAGVVFGVGEMLYEYLTLKRVQWITLASNALVIVLGGLALVEEDGALFKLQPAILVFAFAAFLIVSSLMGKPMLVALVKKQGRVLPPEAESLLGGLNWRLGICMIAIGAVGVHAAYYWTTAAWATYKAVGAPLMMGAYMAVEVLIIRLRRGRDRKTHD